MKEKKGYRIIVYTILALAMDLLGRTLATRLVLPVWCDSIGTFLFAYVAGPVCGAFVGFTNNIIYGFYMEQQSIYCIVGAMLGLVVGYFAKKKVFDSQFKTMTFGMALAIFSTFVAVCINAFMYEGECGNVWGDQVMRLCIDNGFPKQAAYVLGQFCVEFLDKLISVELVYLVITAIKHKRRYWKKSAVLLVMLVCALKAEPVMAEEVAVDYDSYVQTEYAKAEGLLSGEANDIAQTKDGRLWIGTYAGLFQYDGARFKLLSDIPSVKNVNCLYVDEEGRLWIGTNDDGVTILINEHVMNVIDEENGLRSNTVKSIVCDSGGNYYIGTPEGLSVVSLSSGVKVTKTLKQITNVSHMSADAQGNVIVVTDRGQSYWLRDGGLVENPLEVTEDTRLRTVFFTQDKKLILGTSGNEVIVYDMRSGTPEWRYQISLKGLDGINRFYLNEQEELFICTDSGIAVMQKDGSYHKLNTKTFTSSIDNMLVDYQGNLWFSSSRLGLLKLCQSPFVDLFAELGKSEVVNAVRKWKGLLYCGTDDGLVVIDEAAKKEVVNEISSVLENTRIRCLYADHNDQLWIATTEKGVYKVKQRSNGTLAIRNFTEEDGLSGMRFRNILELEDGRIALAGDYGISILKEDAVEQVFTAKDGLENEKTLCLLEYQGILYAGSDGGGITAIGDGRQLKSIAKADGLCSDVILRMVYDKSTDGVFIITSNGICYMKEDGTIRYLDKFPYSNNYDMICREDGTCWVLGSAGIYITEAKDLIDNQKTDYALINAKRGFYTSCVANSWMYTEDEEAYLCCDDGAVKVNMSEYDMSTKSYRMILNSVEVDGVSYEINRVDTFLLSADMEKIIFDPEVLNYSMSDPYVSVCLEGYDKKETVCLLSELDSFSYAKLKPGTYVFRISILDGINGNVVESSRYTLEKQRQMYQNWWFRLYVFLIAGLVLIWLTWFITRSQTQKTLLRQKYELEYAKKQIEMGNETILSIARTVDAKDSNTSQHSYRVSEYSVAIARRLDFPEEKCENLRKMALLHDIGKIGIPDAILNKPGRLTDEEYEIMKTHVIRGGEILKDFKMIENVDVGALYHHEKYDGSGYCHGLKGEEIPLEARIIGIADAFDAMTANRVYRRQLDIEVVIAELKRCSGTQFDPKLVEIMLSLIEDGTINVQQLYEKSKENR